MEPTQELLYLPLLPAVLQHAPSLGTYLLGIESTGLDEGRHQIGSTDQVVYFRVVVRFIGLVPQLHEGGVLALAGRDEQVHDVSQGQGVHLLQSDLVAYETALQPVHTLHLLLFLHHPHHLLQLLIPSCPRGLSGQL